MTDTLRFGSLLFPLLLCAAASAQHRGDIVLDRTPTSIRTNQFDLDGVLIPNIRVFRATLGAAAPNFTDSPGFDCVPGMFPYPSTNGFRIRKALRVWNGAKFAHLPNPLPETLGISFATLGPVSTPVCDETVPGFTLSVGSNGEWHKHLEYTLAEPGTPGVYLLELKVYSSSPTVGQTLPFWLVFLQPAIAGEPAADELAAQDAGVQWVQDHRVPQSCPADFDGNGTVAIDDIFVYLNAWFADNLDADFDGDCHVAIDDIFVYLNAWFAGCP